MGRIPLTKLLLDTHIWIWTVLQPTRLSRRVSRAIDNAENQLWLSPISVWEVVMLTQKGRLRLNEDVASWTRRTIEQLELHEAPLTSEGALETSTLGLLHADPADRLIAATAKYLDLTLVTADERLMAVSGVQVLANQ
jgi:PIN domain nuclease of toxin-antitoxin system